MALDHLTALLETASTTFEKEEAVVELSSARTMIVGDIHGNMKALEFILKMRHELKCEDIVFLGDYVDRGKDSVSVLRELLERKINEPEYFILLRGNHETKEMNRIYGFYDEINDHDLFTAANRTFSRMPVAALLNGSIFCVHGGIPGAVHVNSIDKEHSFPYLWNDPSCSEGMTSSIRGIRPQCFGPDIFNGFMELNHLSLMIRAHTALFNGYTWWFDGKLLSLFSSPEYEGNNNNGAFSILDNNNISIIEFGRTENGEYSIVSREDNIRSVMDG